MNHLSRSLRHVGAIARHTEIKATVAKSTTRAFSGQSDNEIEMLERLLREAKQREVEAAEQKHQAAIADSDGTEIPKFNIGTFNAISPSGLKAFPDSRYHIAGLQDEGSESVEPHAVLLRSFKLGTENVAPTVRAIARCGAGTNNIDVATMTERGIPVFNTPGANANAVKELVICGLLLASRGIVDGIQHVHTIVDEENKDFAKIKKRVESDKKMFVGKELTGKTLGVIGLGHIGASVADTAIALGMEVIGYDPSITMEAAWRLPGQVLERASTIEELCSQVDYLSLHVPYMPETHHLINGELLSMMKPGAHIINYARGELVDTEEMLRMYNSGERTGKYVADFADEHLHDHPKVILMPHLGASTAEAEANSAEMAANQIIDFIETGSIRNSVNFPTVELPAPKIGQARLCIVNKNVPGMLGLITSTLGQLGLNIAQHINTSRDQVAYNAVDIGEMPNEGEIEKIQDAIGQLEGVLSTRLIEGGGRRGPSFFKVNEDM